MDRSLKIIDKDDVCLRPMRNIEFFMRQTKLSELSS